MSKEYKISIVVPVWNKELYIKECVESVLTQLYQNWELILVDDDSPDNCPQICDEYSERDNRIKVIHQKNAGHSEARNTGIRAARGDYIMFLDADDMLYDEEVLSDMVEHVRENDLDICLSKIATLKEGVVTDSTYDYIQLPYDKMRGIEVLCSMIKKSHYHATMCSRMFRARLILENNLFFKKLICDDEEWTPQMFYYANRVGFLDKNGYIIRKLNDSVTGKQDINTKIRKLVDKAYTSTILMKNFDEFYDISNSQKRILYTKFYSFFNMAFWSYSHEFLGGGWSELKLCLQNNIKTLSKYKKYWNIKCQLQYLYSRLKLF